MRSVRIVPREQVDPQAIAGMTIAVIGYGNQGRAQALNLRDSGVAVLVGSRVESRGHGRALADGFEPLPLAEATRRADIVHLLLPDDAMGPVFAEHIAPALRPGVTLTFSHGFAIRFGTIVPPEGCDVTLVSPKAIGTQVRALYEQGRGAPVLVAVHRDASGTALARACAHAAALGGSRAGIVETTIADETECDLFGEQAVLCGGLLALIQASFETLVDAGYPPEMAYFECIHELKLITDMVHDRGLAAMFDAISPAAAHGAFTRAPRIIPESTRAEMRAMLEQIRSGEFAREYLGEMDSGGASLRARRQALHRHPSEEAGARVRALLPWLTPKQ